MMAASGIAGAKFIGKVRLGPNNDEIRSADPGIGLGSLSREDGGFAAPSLPWINYSFLRLIKNDTSWGMSMDGTGRERRQENGVGVELLMPDPARKNARQRLMGVVEDADFEVLGNGRSNWPDSIPPQVVPVRNSVPFAQMDAGRRNTGLPPAGERLDLFGKACMRGRTPAFSLAFPVFVVLLCLSAGSAFWMSGGYTLFLENPAAGNRQELVTMERFRKIPAAITPAISLSPQVGATSTNRQIEPVPPPRIERAGSILMIRTGGQRQDGT